MKSLKKKDLNPNLRNLQTNCSTIFESTISEPFPGHGIKPRYIASRKNGRFFNFFIFFCFLEAILHKHQKKVICSIPNSNRHSKFPKIKPPSENSGSEMFHRLLAVQWNYTRKYKLFHVISYNCKEKF